MTMRIVQTAMGIIFAIIGAVVITAAVAVLVLAKGVTMWGVILVVVGALIMFLGGVMVPHSGVADGAATLGTIVQPYLRYLPGGRRVTDPPIAEPAVPVPPEVKP